MQTFRLTERAKQDLRSIGRYTQATWGREQRNIYLAKLDACFHLLAQEPQRGRVCDDIRSGYRKVSAVRPLRKEGSQIALACLEITSCLTFPTEKAVLT